MLLAFPGVSLDDAGPVKVRAFTKSSFDRQVGAKLAEGYTVQKVVTEFENGKFPITRYTAMLVKDGSSGSKNPAFSTGRC